MKKKKKYKLQHKKLLRLKTNTLNNNKFLRLIIESEKTITKRRKEFGQIIIEKIIIRRFAEIAKKKKEKWRFFQRQLVKANQFFQKYRPHTFHTHKVSKLASQGNSFSKQYRHDLFTKKIFINYYGGFKRKYLKKQMTILFKTTKSKESYRNLCAQLFESRLDSALKKAYFCSTIKEARQIIRHKHVKVNNRIETNYTYTLKPGDYVKIKKSSWKMIRTKIRKNFIERFNLIIWPTIPDYLSVNYRMLEIIFVDISRFRFSSSFTFKNELERVTESFRRH